jgi:cytochrome c-type biogenesis protein CcmH/NrfG
MAQGKTQNAKKALWQAIRLQPDLAEAHHRLEQVRAAKNHSQQLIQSARYILHTLFRRE